MIARRSSERLLHWLINEACPLWSTHGVDRARGGFYERVDGITGLDEPRRARVQPRQVAAFSRAAVLGWTGDAAELATHGLDYFLTRYRRPDNLFRTLVSPDGVALDDRALLYDQTFALLAFAESQRVLGRAPRLLDEARRTRAAIYRHLKRVGPGFETALGEVLPLSANAHMHFFEAALAWLETSDDPEWRTVADEIAALALERFVDPVTGAMREHFTASWTPLRSSQGRLIEPGHHFEWAWLLLRWAGQGGDRHDEAQRVALRLIDVAEAHGVRNGVALNALLDDFSVQDNSARLWPQTERLRVSALAAELTGELRYWKIADEAKSAILRYLDTRVRGSWFDRQLPTGAFVAEPAPASTFYHLVAALAQLEESAAAQRPPEASGKS